MIKTTIYIAIATLGITHAACWLHQPLAGVKTVEVYRSGPSTLQFEGDLTVKQTMFSTLVLHRMRWDERVKISQLVSRNGTVIDTEFKNINPKVKN